MHMLQRLLVFCPPEGVNALCEIQGENSRIECKREGNQLVEVCFNNCNKATRYWHVDMCRSYQQL